ncbi:MAG: hypothetical protein II621_01280 [Clostridia bacterium]|nr:hypothetical protein [Clostridia bacterium]
MDAVLTHNINTNRPQRPQISQKQMKCQEQEILQKNNNEDKQDLTKEQAGLLNEFRQKINPETVKESLKHNNNIKETNNNGFQAENFDPNNEYMVMTALEDSTRIPLNVEDLLIQENYLCRCALNTCCSYPPAPVRSRF